MSLIVIEKSHYSAHSPAHNASKSVSHASNKIWLHMYKGVRKTITLNKISLHFQKSDMASAHWEGSKYHFKKITHCSSSRLYLVQFKTFFFFCKMFSAVIYNLLNCHFLASTTLSKALRRGKNLWLFFVNYWMMSSECGIVLKW